MLEPSGHFKAPTFIELFCGVGGFAIGFGEEGFECRGAIDFDELCCQDHLALTGHEAWCVDIQHLTPEDLLRALERSHGVQTDGTIWWREAS